MGCSLCFFFNGPATTEIYTLSLHDALPISWPGGEPARRRPARTRRRFHRVRGARRNGGHPHHRSEEHTSELQSRLHLVCRLLLEKKKQDRLKSPLRSRWKHIDLSGSYA